MSSSPLDCWVAQPKNRIVRRRIRRASQKQTPLRIERLERRDVPAVSALPPSIVSGYVYHDVDDNGVRDAGEAGIAGVTITLSGTDVFDQNISVSTLTDADGNYSFNTVDPGVYYITETQPEGWIDGQEGVGTGVEGGIAANDQFWIIVDDCELQARDFNFGEKRLPPPPRPSSISGTVYCDANSNGVQDAGEEGIAGVYIDIAGILADGRDWGTAITSTDANGFYQFSNLLPGSYTIAEAQPAGYTDGLDTLGTPFAGIAGNDVLNVMITAADADQAGTGYNFGEIGPSSISGSVYIDANYNGIWDAGDRGLAGVAIYLLGTDFNNQPVSLTTITDANGNYEFLNLQPGVYRLVEVPPANLISGRTQAGTAGGVEFDDEIADIRLEACAKATGYFFGEAECPPEDQLHTLSGHVFNDCNNNGIYDVGELPIAGVIVTLTGTQLDGVAVSRTTTTNAAGEYLFTDLKPGTYRLDETQPAAYLDGKDAAGTPFGGTATGVGGDSITNIVVPNSPQPLNGVNYDFGEVNSSVSGLVYVDNNINGVNDPGEPGLAGVTVTLTGTNDLNENVAVTTTTAADGTYAFNRLRPGLYKINETQPPGYVDGVDTVGTAGGSNAVNDELSGINLDGCTHAKGYNFGECLKPNLHSLSGYVYDDCPNNDGVKDPGELGIAGVTIVLTGTDDLGAAVTRTTVTDANGFYKFSDLRAGTYKVVEQQPADYLDGKDKAGTPFAANATVSDEFSNVVIPPSPVSLDGVNFNFGELKPSAISGFVFIEKDGTPNYTNRGAAVGDVPLAGIAATPNDTVRAAATGDVPLAGVTVTLTGTTDLGVAVTASTTTNAAGFYEFKGLRPGTYALRETQPTDPGLRDDLDFAGTIKGGTVGTVANDLITNIILPACEVGQEYNFGEKLPEVKPEIPNTISGYVYHDLNKNGVKDPGEPGIPCVRVVLTGTSTADAPNGGPVNRTISTSATGFYQFLNVYAGTYTLTETQPIAFLDFMESIGTPFTAQLLVNDQISNINVPRLPGGLDGVNYNFGEWREPSKYDFIVHPPPPDCGDGINRGVAGFVVTPQINDFTPIRRAFTAVGAPEGAAPLVKVVDAVNNQDLFPPFLAYNQEFRGGVRVATGDVNGDGYKDIVTSPGPGGAPFVAVYSGLSGTLLKSLQAYDAGFTGGVSVATGDVDGDGKADIITAPSSGGPHVKVFSGATYAEIQNFMAYAPNYFGGVTVAAGDVDGDGKAEVITGPMTGSTTDNKVSVSRISAAGVTQVTSFVVPDALAGVNLAVGDLDGDNKAEIVVGPTNNVNSKVRVFRGTDGVEIGSYNAFDTTFVGGIRLASADLDGDKKSEVVASAVANNTARIRILGGLTGTLVRELSTAVVSSTANVYLAAGSAFGVV